MASTSHKIHVRTQAGATMTSGFEVKVSGWGSDFNARRVSPGGKRKAAAIRRLLSGGAIITLLDCPPANGQTGIRERKLIQRGGRFYCRVPE